MVQHAARDCNEELLLSPCSHACTYSLSFRVIQRITPYKPTRTETTDICVLPFHVTLRPVCKQRKLVVAVHRFTIALPQPVATRW